MRYQSLRDLFILTDRMGKTYDHVAIIVPIYNEAPVIGGVLTELAKQFTTIVCVNDGSRDGSAKEIAKTSAYLVGHPFNMGQGGALQTGTEFARSLPDIEYFVHFDADGQHQVEDILSIITELEKGQHDIILGSRFLGSTIGMKRGKELLLRLAIRFSNLTTGLKLTDTHNGLRGFNRHVAETMQITLPDMAHASEILEIIVKNGYRYKEIPVTIEYSDYSRAKGQAYINAINVGFDGLLRRIAR